jgi:ElaB/YqjD/DUF883 family membrane-anchored ribosome-binding protein
MNTNLSGTQTNPTNGSKSPMTDSVADVATATAVEAVQDIRAKTGQALASAKEKMSAAQAALKEKSQVYARATDEFVQKNPWQSVSIAAGVGLLVGLLIGRMKQD